MAEQPIPVITQEQALQLCTRPEDQFYDRKSALAKAKSAQKIAVALANAEGGEATFGIKDDKEEPDPKKKLAPFLIPEDANDILHNIYQLNPAVTFRYSFYKIENIDGYILRVFFEKTQHVHATADGNVYKRLGASSVLVSPSDIPQLAFSKGAISFENTKLTGHKPEEIIETNQAKFLASSIKEGSDPLAFSINEGLIDREDWTPLVAGALLFSENPQGIIPTRCECRIVFYDTRLEKPEREHLKINETIGGPLYSQIFRVVERVSEIISGISILTPEGMKKVKYPPEAIWEIITNAVIHRDYSIADDIQIVIFQNRIEIISPGTLPGFVSLRNILDVRYSRNPKIVRTLRRYPNAPNQDLGEGLNTAFQKMQDSRLKPPTIEILNNSVKVTISHTPLATPEEAVIEYLKTNDSITNRQSRELTGIRSENQMKEVLYRLRDQGIIYLDPKLKGNKATWRKK